MNSNDASLSPRVMIDRAWLTVQDAASYAAVSTDTIYTACEQRKLQHAKIGGRRSIRLKTEWVDAWLEQHAVCIT